MKFIMSTLQIKLKNNPVGALNVEFLFVKFIVLCNNIPDWLKLTAEGRLKEAYEISQSTNNMPEVCKEFVHKIDCVKGIVLLNNQVMEQ